MILFTFLYADSGASGLICLNPQERQDCLQLFCRCSSSFGTNHQLLILPVQSKTFDFYLGVNNITCFQKKNSKKQM